MSRLELVNIVPGYWCNLSCDHCVNDSGPNRQDSGLTEKEIDLLVHELNASRPKTLLFTGGEPSLYLEPIRNVLSKLTYDFEVGITTNGFFARSIEAVANVLDSIQELSSVQLSFDDFHRDTLSSSKPFYLRDYCRNKNIAFNISVSISDPRGLIFAAEVEKKYQVPVIFQKIEASGRAKIKKTAFRNETFDPSVLESVCPNADTVAFICGKGFSPCCSNLVFNSNEVESAWPSLKTMRESLFYQELVGQTLGDRAIRNGIDIDNLGPEMSSPCTLCEFISVVSHAQKA